MALTKVSGDFIQDGSITQGHLHASHGITTSDIGEGSNLYFTTARVNTAVGNLSTSDLSEGTNLYYTDARVSSYLTTNNYVTSSSTHTFTNKSGNISQWTNDSGYITDGNTNWDNSYGFITASSTETLTNKSGNISMFTNDSGYITDGNTNWNNSYGFITASSTDTLTNKSGNISQWTNDSGYITSYDITTQTDPKYLRSNAADTLSAAITLDNSGYFVGSPSYGFRFNNSGDTINALIVDNSGNSIAYASHRAPIFYDKDDTGYYVNPNSSSRLYNIVVGDGTPDTTPDGVAFSNTIKSVGSNNRVVNFEGVGGVISTWYTVGNTAYGAIDQGTSYMSFWQNQGLGWSEQFRIYRGYQQSQNQLRAPIFYDSNDTAYYLDPNGTSNLNGVTIAGDLRVGGTTKFNVIPSGWSNSNADQWPYLYWHRDTGNGWDEGLIKNSSSRGFFSKAGWGIHMDSSRAFHIFSSGWTANFGVEHGGNAFANGQMRAPIFYDYNDTNYYINPNSTSQISQMAIGTTSWDTTNLTLDVAGNASFRSGFYMGISTNNYGSWSGRIYTSGSTQYWNGQTWYFTGSGWGGGTYWSLDNSGNSVATGSHRAPIFYDSNDTNYYLDPNTTGTSLNVAGKINASNFNGTNFKYLGTGVSYDINSRTTKVSDGIAIYGAYSGGSNSPHTYDMSMQVVGNSRGFELSAAWWSQTALYIRTLRDCCTNWSSWYAIAIHGLNLGTTAGALYAQEFYDSNDTGYYINPSSSSKFSGLKLEPQSSVNQASGDDNVLWIHRVNNNDWGIQINADQGSATDYGYEFLGGASHTYAFSGVAAGTRYFNVGSSYAQHDGSFRAPIFYDSNNTGYYTDPASNSTLYDLTLTGSKHTYLYVNPGNGYEAMTRYNGGSGNTWYVGSRTSSDLIGSTDAWHVYSQTAGRTVSGTDTGGNIFAYGSSRAPIFYEKDNTGYYVDPAGWSNLSSGRIGSYLQIGTTGNTTHTPGINMAIGSDIYWRQSTYSSNADIWMESVDNATYLTWKLRVSSFDTTSWTDSIVVFNHNFWRGYVGILRSPEYPLDLNGQARLSGGYTTSDVRLKKNIRDNELGLSHLLQLRTRLFDWITDEEILGRTLAFQNSL